MDTNTKYIKSELIKMRRAISVLNYAMDKLERHPEGREGRGKELDRIVDILEDVLLVENNSPDDEDVLFVENNSPDDVLPRDGEHEDDPIFWDNKRPR